MVKVMRFLAAAVLIVSCSEAHQPSFLAAEPQDAQNAPALLSGTKLYEDFSGRIVNREFVPYSPKFPLWTDGAAKDRWAYLPGVIDSRDQNNWVFPRGTTFFKEFSYNNKPVETRMLLKVEEQAGFDSWKFATYRWREDGSDADLVADEGATDVAPTEFPGVSHDIPNLGQCQRCHTRTGEPVLGFSATQLDENRNAYIPHSTLRPGDLTNDKMAAQKLLTHPVTHVQEKILDPVALAAVGYLYGNCGSCHSPGGVKADLGMNLSYDQNATRREDLPIYKTVVNVFAHPSDATGGAADVYRIKAGEPEESLLLKRISARGSAMQMPPFGSEVVDDKATALIRQWIKEMESPLHPTDRVLDHRSVFH